MAELKKWKAEPPGDHAGVVSALVEAGAEVDRRVFVAPPNHTATPLMCSTKQYDVAKILLDAGANVNLKDSAGRTVADSKDPVFQGLLRGEAPPAKKGKKKEEAGPPASGGKETAARPAAGPAAPPKVANVQMEERDQAVHVTYDLAASGPAQVALVGSLDGGKTFALKITAVSGDVGPAVQPGSGKKMVWSVRQDHPAGLDDKDVTLEVRATLASVP